MCKANPRKEHRLFNKRQTTYHYQQGLLIRSFIDETELVKYQMALPQVAVIDLLIILHRKHSHLGREKLDAKFSENYFCFNLNEYITMVIINCYSCQLNLQIPRRRTGHYTHRKKIVLTSPGNMFFADCFSPPIQE